MGGIMNLNTRSKIKKYITTFVRYLLVIVALVFFLFPIYWLVLTSFKFPGDINANPVIWIPGRITIDNFRLLLGYTGPVWGSEEYTGRSFYQSVTPYLVNSLVAGGASSIFGILLGSFLAHGIVYFGVGRGKLYTWILSLRMVHPVVIAIPLFLVFRTISLVDSWAGLAIAHLLISLPFATLLLIGFFTDMPRELIDASRLDGLTHIGAFFRIVLPLVAPGLVAVFVISFLTSWNELLIANALTNSVRSQTFPVFTSGFLQVERGTSWGIAAAGGVIGMLPMLLSISYIQRYLVRGLTLGAVTD
jgi:multiple sugar transport system permease protein